MGTGQRWGTPNLKPTQEWPVILEPGQTWNPIGLFSPTVVGGTLDLVTFASFQAPQGLFMYSSACSFLEESFINLGGINP